jgi:TatD DNase family protein
VSKHEGFAIQSLYQDFESMTTLLYYSIGLHPRFIQSDTYQQEFEKIKLLSQKENVVAIGECGLDRLSSTDFKLQEKVFIEHINLANQIAKPIIIHCVRAHRETLQLLKTYKVNVPVIFHGYNNNEQIAQQIIQEKYMLSLGKSLFNSNIETLFSKMPLDKLFLENDNGEKDIKEIYDQACKIKNISLEQLSLQMKKNCVRVFNKTIN